MSLLRESLEKNGIVLDEQVIEKLETYQAMLMDWNTRMDLTSVRDGDMASRHFVDSLLPMKTEGLIPKAGKLIDVGTGAGFPGMPLAIANPELKVVLLDAQEKRCNFLRAVKEELHLDNVEILHGRAEDAGRDGKLREQFDRAVARAVAALNVLSEYLLPFIKVGGRMLCWKGPGAVEEVPAAKSAIAQLGGKNVCTLPMAYENEHHVLVCADKKEKTLPQFPRKNGIPSKRPLK